MYKRGIAVEEKQTAFPSPSSTKYAAQVVVGTAPIHMAANSRGVTNKPVKVSSFDEAREFLGYSDDWKSYTLCQSMFASFQIFHVAPVVFINVLDPERHTKDNAKKEYQVTEHQAVLEESGILKDTVRVENTAGTAYTNGTDYLLTVKNDGKLMITLLSTGAAYAETSIRVTCKNLAPELVTEADIIGAIDTETGKETGLESVRRIYPEHGLVPAILLAPGWSQKPNVGAALMGKCEGINGTFRAECLLDLDTALAKRYFDCEAQKKEAGYTGEHAIVLWPRVTRDGKQLAYSAVYGAMMSYYTAINQDVPYLYPSNKPLGIDGAVLADGTEIFMDQVQAGALNGAGIVTVINDNAWKSFGNNTGCYPGNTDPKDRWIGCRRMFSFLENYFSITYRERLDENMSKRTVDDIINGLNIWGNGLAAAGMCAGLRAEFDEGETGLDDILSGHIKIKFYFAPYTPVEYILATSEFDTETLKNVLSV